jgi:hypothetical protein
MRSVRLDAELDARLQEVARLTGQPVSRIIRDAVRRQCDRWLSRRLDARLADVIGSVASGGGSSRSTGKAFTRLLANRKRSRQ